MGDAPIQGAKQLAITHVTMPGRTLPTADLPKIYEHFAPSQFFHLSDRQRLEQPGFERMQAGLTVATGGVNCAGVRAMPLGYEEIEIPPEPGAAANPFGVVIVAPALVAWMVTGGAAAKGPAATKRRFAGKPLGINVREHESFVISDATTLTEDALLSSTERYTTAAEAFAAARGRDVVVALAEEPVA
jgi:hypothetical protein